MKEADDLLFELGTEELPPKHLAKLATALADQIEAGLNTAELSFKKINWYATPRRLAVLVSSLQTQQSSREELRRGPAYAAAYDKDGNPSKAAEGFARSCQTTVDQLDTLETEKGKWLTYSLKIEGKSANDLLGDIIIAACQKLPIAKRMRWGNKETEFVRPVHWSILLLGSTIIDCEILGTQTSNISYGHRFHAPNAITIKHPADYKSVLKKPGYVIVDYSERKKLIVEKIKQLADRNNAVANIDENLLDEVTSINEWPVPVMGGFDEAYLELPKEVLIASMQDHQKYFPLVNKSSELLPKFITFANIDSKNIDSVRKGNERVLSPRLNDARFFWQQDLRKKLADYCEGLDSILYQKQLGSMGEKSARVATLAKEIAHRLSANETLAVRAAELAKCDLLTDMVGEFPELQGTIGYYYAIKSGEDNEVAIAINEQYMPRFSGDSLPSTNTGQILSLAEKLDTIVGIFSIGQIPTGDKDPFALKRAALGVLRILIECKLELDLHELLLISCQSFSHDFDHDSCAKNVFDFMMERLRGYYLENGIDTLTFESVLARKPIKPLDYHHRIEAVMAFQKLSESADLAAANKRISNILKKTDEALPTIINSDLLTDKAEIDLAKNVNEIKQIVDPLFADKKYSEVLSTLARLRDPIDKFFDDVMVMTDDAPLRINRLCLLQSVSQLFLQTADISKLQASK